MARWPSASSYPGTPKAYPATPKAYPATLSAFPAAGGGDVAAPTLVSAVTNAAGDEITLTYDEALDTGSQSAVSAWALNGTSAAVATRNVTGSTVVLGLDATIYPHNTVTIDYTPPGSNPIQDLAGNDAGALTGQAVTNNSTVTYLTIVAAHDPTLGVLFYGDADTITQSGGFCDQLTDQSGNGAHFTASTTARPSVITGTNGRQGLSFDGVDDYMTAASLVLPDPDTTPTFYRLVVQQRSHTTTERILNAIGAASTSHILQQITASPNIRQFNGAAANNNSGLPVGTTKRVECLFSSSINDYIQAGAVNVGGTTSGGDSVAQGMRIAANQTPSLFAAIDVYKALVTNRSPNISCVLALDAFDASFFGGGVL